MNAQQIIADIDAYMKEWEGKKHQWYVGISSDVEQTLFGDHAVTKRGRGWIYRHADTSAIARAVETAYHEAGCDGGPGGGDAFTTIVYAYRKSAGTDP